jgi:hypothetical protein
MIIACYVYYVPCERVKEKTVEPGVASAAPHAGSERSSYSQATAVPKPAKQNVLVGRP